MPATSKVLAVRVITAGASARARCRDCAAALPTSVLILAWLMLPWSGGKPQEKLPCACYIRMQMAAVISPEENLTALGLALPQLPAPGGNYVAAKRMGAVVYLSGVISTGADGVITGTVGADRSIEDGYAAARACALTQLAVLKRELGSLDAIAE